MKNRISFDAVPSALRIVSYLWSMIEIKLTSQEILKGAMVGIMRQTENLKKKAQPAYGAGSKDDWQLHIEGALGECALAKYLNVYWSGKGEMRNPDVGPFDVRTRSRHDYELILHPNDPDERTFWLLTGSNGVYRIHGCIKGKDGKKKEFWKDPAGGRPAFFVPQSELTLRQEIQELA